MILSNYFQTVLKAFADGFSGGFGLEKVSIASFNA